MVWGWPHGNVHRFRGGLVFKAHRLWYHSTLGLPLIKKNKENGRIKQPFLFWKTKYVLNLQPPKTPKEGYLKQSSRALPDWPDSGRSGQFSIEEQLLLINVKRFRGALVFKAHRLLYHLILDLRVIKKRRRSLKLGGYVCIFGASCFVVCAV